jgi:uncharacterized protein YbjT (DUF2867 family)
MKVILLGATGMVGQDVLRECLLDPEVEKVVAIGRNATAQRHEKLHTTTFLISLQLKVGSRATTHAFSALASPQ